MSAAAIEISVLLFAAAREAAGTERTTLELPPPATAATVLDAVVARYPALAPHRSSLRLAVNAEYVEPAHLVEAGDEVALIPPTCGG